MTASISSARLRDVHGEVGVQEKANRSPLRNILDHEESGSGGGGGPAYFKKKGIVGFCFEEELFWFEANNIST